jgi:peptidoglycan/xylan/chitin deacetylase (PgdA/CDA1 family)
MRIDKRGLVAEVAGSLGITRLLESMPKQDVLIVLNYHRIGNAPESPYDPGVFSATAEEFHWQIAYLKRRFYLTTLDEAVAMVTGSTPLRTSVLITFDDGYLDNYSVAFQVLRSHGAQGVFFLTTSFVGSNHVPWWDVIAYVIKNSNKSVIQLQYPERVEFDLRRQPLNEVIMRVLQLYKRPEVKLPERFVQELETACESSAPSSNAERCFMNWQEAREMQQGGMAFGSHTHTHEILSKLPFERQLEEARQSRETLEMQLNRRVDVLAYPVGGRNCFTPETIEALKSCGYRAAFSFYGEFNRPGEIQPFNICRVGVGPQSQSRFRLKMALGALTGTRWF